MGQPRVVEAAAACRGQHGGQGARAEAVTHRGRARPEHGAGHGARDRDLGAEWRQRREVRGGDVGGGRRPRDRGKAANLKRGHLGKG